MANMDETMMAVGRPGRREGDSADPPSRVAGHRRPHPGSSPAPGGREEAEIPDGFPGERMRVLPRPLVNTALATPITSTILVTDAGYFPHAIGHGRRRRAATEAIVIACTRGSGQCEINGMQHQVDAGQVLMVPGGVPHHYYADPADPWTIWWMHVTGDGVPPLVHALQRVSDGPVLQPAEPARIALLMERILTAMETDESRGSLIAAGGAAWHLLSVLAADASAPRRSRRHPIREVQRHLRENLAERFGVEELAAIAGYSSSHFSALFRKESGYGPLEYQTRLRMSRARELLDTTDRPVAVIAAEVGYADPMYFSRQFRRIHDMSPTRYRSRGAPETG